jgi:hypothetical protein
MLCSRSFLLVSSVKVLGGEGGIRTPGGVTHARFQIGHHKPLGHFSLAESEGFEPSVVSPTPAFQTGTLSRSATIPGWVAAGFEPSSRPACRPSGASPWMALHPVTFGGAREIRTPGGVTHTWLATKHHKPLGHRSVCVGRRRSASPSSADLGTPGRTRTCNVGIRSPLPRPLGLGGVKALRGCPELPKGP